MLASLFARLAPLAPRSGRTAGFPRPCAFGAAASSRPGSLRSRRLRMSLYSSLSDPSEPPLDLLPSDAERRRPPVGADRRLPRAPELAHQIAHLFGGELEVHLDRRVAGDAGGDAAPRLPHRRAPAISLPLGEGGAHEANGIESTQARGHGSQEKVALSEGFDVI